MAEWDEQAKGDEGAKGGSAGNTGGHNVEKDSSQVAGEEGTRCTMTLIVGTKAAHESLTGVVRKGHLCKLRLQRIKEKWYNSSEGSSDEGCQCRDRS